MKKVDFKLYLITDRKVVHNGNLISAVESALQCGVTAVQLREKDLSTKELFELAYDMRLITHMYGAKLFINDRLDVALCVQADGVHLTQNSFGADVARKMVSKNISNSETFLIGMSVHSVDEAIKARDKKADFITLGPIYETPSKIQYGPPLGPDLIEEVLEWVEGLPCFALGGIKSHNVNEVLECGADGIALISGILGANDICKETEKFMELLKDD